MNSWLVGSLFWLIHRRFCIAAGKPAVAVTHICRQSRSTRLIQRITVNITFTSHIWRRCWKWFSSAREHTSNATNMLLSVSQSSFAGSRGHDILNPFFFFFNRFRCEAYYYKFYSLIRPARKQMTGVQIWRTRKPQSPADYYHRKHLLNRT